MHFISYNFERKNVLLNILTIKKLTLKFGKKLYDVVENVQKGEIVLYI